MHDRAYDDYHVAIKQAIKSAQGPFWKKTVMHVKGRLASSPDDSCDIFIVFV
jgi:hypothetical protein